MTMASSLDDARSLVTQVELPKAISSTHPRPRSLEVRSANYTVVESTTEAKTASILRKLFKLFSVGLKVCFQTSAPMLEHDSGAVLLGPRQPHSHKKCLVLDLDETLVHSTLKPMDCPDFIVPVSVAGELHHFYVKKRPGVDAFLEYAGNHFEVVVFTASMPSYASPVIDMLDLTQTVSARLYRDSCRIVDGDYVKDLDVLGRPLNETLIVDNSPLSYKTHTANAIGIETWIQREDDAELKRVQTLLELLRDQHDVRPILLELRAHELGADPDFLGK
ncbi:NLI interacting factor-like phosphatase [Carpediemonas membranifera]|uniref:NLI interacting factor-like phosphatase n=1 Tax=Carpediemonas membranifera TaxID=201153 RepID=A0A8J6APU5_9EUKA|nr:NLI interacting factor-like phosphatase [Carpediemonas membranifera]|eukprot:KAG9390496.1 NLI interacting factor-like phosphatase [Carpediemonas membranifera]